MSIAAFDIYLSRVMCHLSLGDIPALCGKAEPNGDHIDEGILQRICRFSSEVFASSTIFADQPRPLGGCSIYSASFISTC